VSLMLVHWFTQHEAGGLSKPPMLYQLILCTGVALSNSVAINQPVTCIVTVLKDEAACKATLRDIGAKPRPSKW
jgi:hypothetical protein